MTPLFADPKLTACYEAIKAVRSEIHEGRLKRGMSLHTAKTARAINLMEEAWALLNDKRPPDEE